MLTLHGADGNTTDISQHLLPEPHVCLNFGLPVEEA